MLVQAVIQDTDTTFTVMTRRLSDERLRSESNFLESHSHEVANVAAEFTMSLQTLPTILKKEQYLNCYVLCVAPIFCNQ